jgi:hypothetical protein
LDHEHRRVVVELASVAFYHGSNDEPHDQSDGELVGCLLADDIR